MKRLTNKKSQFESVSELLYCKTVYKVQSSIEPYNEEIKIKKGRWLSGRKRQTVNLLGNSRWFEPNSSQISINNELWLQL